jgi:hypothetical protein
MQIGRRTVVVAGTPLEKTIPTNFYCSVVEEKGL